MSLKELTKENHSNAERSWFASLMFSGKITENQYAIYLRQQHEIYNALEKRFDCKSEIKFPDDRIKRAEKINLDLLELDPNVENLPILNSTSEYVDYIDDCPEHLLYAHVYVRYLGDLKGGQMIAKRVPGSGQYYKFESPSIIEAFIRSKLREDSEFVDECKKCFSFATELFNDLKKYLVK